MSHQQNGNASNQSSGSSTDNQSRLKELKLGKSVDAKELSVYSESDVKHHTSEKDCWMIIHGLVYDVTKFLEDHPGGPEILLQNAGTDATNEFEQVFHSAQARSQLADYIVGIAKEYTGPLDAATNQSSGGSTATKQASAGSATGGSTLVFVIPVVVIVAALAYQYLL